jgi:hypothetical protein
LFSTRQSAQKPKLVTLTDEDQQSDYLIGRILEHHEAGIALRKQAVLFRTSYHSDALEVELGRRNIPFVKYGGLKFLEAAHVKDVLSILRLTRAKTTPEFVSTVEGRIHALRRAAPVVAALPPDQWSDRAATLSQQLDVSHGIALNEILDAHTAWSNDPNGQARAHAAERLAPLQQPTPIAPGDPATRWADLADRINPDLTKDQDWPTLAEHISRAADSGFHVDTRLPLLIADRPLDPAHRARDLDLRLIDACPGCLPQPDSVVANDNREHTVRCTNDLGQGLSTERICSCQSDAGSSARSSRLRRSSW